MAEYRISGYWKGHNGEISHYALHTVFKGSFGRSEKKSKAQVLAMLAEKGTTASTWIWDYETASWHTGTAVELIKAGTGNCLQCAPNNLLTINLAHLIDYGWVLNNL